MRIDLHTHSNASDGTDTPAELVVAARAAAKLDVVALTDHDTAEGWEPAIAALPPGLTLVPGAELSCVARHPDGGSTTMHLLAYLFDPAEPELRAERRRVRDSRINRGQLIVDRLRADGYPLRWERVRELAAGGAVGRPHIARALIELGVVSSVEEAFDRFLYTGSPYYVYKEDIDAERAVRLVRAAGGVPVFAHPLARRRGKVVGDDVIAALAAAGLGGIEVDHVDQEPADRVHLAGLARDLGLVATGSSDYHGCNKKIPLGANLTDPAEYDAIVEQATGFAPVTA